MMFPLVRDLAAEGIPVRLTCGVLGFSAQAFYKWAMSEINPLHPDLPRIMMRQQELQDKARRIFA